MSLVVAVKLRAGILYNRQLIVTLRITQDEIW